MANETSVETSSHSGHEGVSLGYQRTVSSRCAGCAVVPANTTLNVYVPAGNAS